MNRIIVVLRVLGPLWLVLVLAVQGGILDAQEAPPQSPDQLQELYQRVLELEPDRQNRLLIERARAAAQQEAGVDTTAQSWIHVKGSSLTWGGQLQGDWVHWAQDSQFGGQPDYFEFRRLRLLATGQGYGVCEYMLELDFAPAIQVQGNLEDDGGDRGWSGIELKDAYVGMNDLPWLGTVRLGHFKAPLGLSELTSNKYLTFLERPLGNVFVPGRELGIAALSGWGQARGTWACGVFFDQFDEAAHFLEDDNQGTRLVGRLTWTPYYDELFGGRALVHLGMGYAYTRPRKQPDPDDPAQSARLVRFRARPEIHRGAFLLDTGDLEAKHYHVANVEMACVYGPFSIQSEMYWASIEQGIGADTDLYAVDVAGSWFLTGEHRPYDRAKGVFDRVVPLENFWAVRTPTGCQVGRGAWELAARWSFLDFSAVRGQQLHDLTVGLNWYWNPHTRMMLDWIHPFARLSPASPRENAQADIVAMRFQVDF